VGKSSPEGGRWARLGFDPSFYKGKIFVFPFILSHICCKTAMFFFISFHIVKYLLQNSNVVYHVCGMLKVVETKNYMFGFPNAILNFFFAADTFPRYFNIYIFGWAKVCWPLLCFWRLFMILEGRRMSEFELGVLLYQAWALTTSPHILELRHPRPTGGSVIF
jgi:hypothetical protein